MENLYSLLYKSLLFCSVVIFFVGFMGGSSGPVAFGANIAGNVTLILAVLMVLLVVYNGIMPLMDNMSGFNQAFTIFYLSGPFLLLLGNLGLLLYLTITNKDLIRRNLVDPQYFRYSNLSLLLIILQTYLIYTTVFGDQFERTGRFSSVTISLLYLTSLLISLCTIVIYILLQLYKTDGFCAACMVPAMAAL